MPDETSLTRWWLDEDGDSALRDSRPLPLIVAEKWNFRLQYYLIESVAWYAIQDWIVGLTGSTTIKAGEVWRQMKKHESSRI